LIGSLRRRLSRLAGCDRATPTHGEQQLWKRKFAARDFGRDAPRKVLSIRQTDSRDRFPADRLRKSRAISGRGKSRRFAPTAWWSAGDSNRELLYVAHLQFDPPTTNVTGAVRHHDRVANSDPIWPERPRYYALKKICMQGRNNLLLIAPLCASRASSRPPIVVCET
jgi:hypothetical protein